jgi:hypothetical protein
VSEGQAGRSISPFMAHGGRPFQDLYKERGDAN